MYLALENIWFLPYVFAVQLFFKLDNGWIQEQETKKDGDRSSLSAAET